MDIKTQLKSLLNQAGLYHSQGLLDEAMERYDRTQQLIRENEALKRNKDLIDFVSKKITALKNDIDKIEGAPAAPEMSTEVQDVIKHKFSFSKDKDAAALEGAVALAKFSQFERALKELNELMKRDAVRLAAAKHTIWCHVARNSIDDAIADYESWSSGDLFSPWELNRLRMFLQDILDKNGIDRTLPEVEESVDSKEAIIEEEREDREFPPISSVELALGEKLEEGETMQFDVGSQSENAIRFLIRASEKELIEQLQVGTELNEVRFYSPITVFESAAVVSSNSRIESGPRRGDYSLEIRIS
ncbi:MAG: hypothetical protein SV775_14615 [Thermodesulfobacteriota bacterium]|nr:hypothetical protein [Thermodesulfobacteriota bacterium]